MKVSTNFISSLCPLKHLKSKGSGLGSACPVGRNRPYWGWGALCVHSVDCVVRLGGEPSSLLVVVAIHELPLQACPVR